MDNSFFIFTEKGSSIKIERLHICTWEFKNNSSLVEFGIEINKESIIKDDLAISLFIPWAEQSCETRDLYDKLKIADNSRFIFNDSISGNKFLKDSSDDFGIIYTFSGRNELCIIPAEIKINEDKVVSATLDLTTYRAYGAYDQGLPPNIYFRFWIKPSVKFISMRKKGLNKSTIIYDIKVNERRNAPYGRTKFIDNQDLCKIKYCFSFNILPNKYDIVFFENASLKNVRTLEYESFNKYLGDKRVKKDELIVVFNKKEVKEFDSKNVAESFTFFSIYSMERIGPGQFALAILINIVCGVLLFLPAYRKTFSPELSFSQVWSNLPYEIFSAFGVVFITLMYFTWPIISNTYNRILNWCKNKKGKNEGIA